MIRRTAQPRLTLPALTAVACLCLGLAGCARSPGIAAQEALAADAPYPDLMATGTLLAQAPAPRIEAEDPEAQLAARAALLRRRANALRSREFDT